MKRKIILKAESDTSCTQAVTLTAEITFADLTKGETEDFVENYRNALNDFLRNAIGFNQSEIRLYAQQSKRKKIKDIRR